MFFHLHRNFDPALGSTTTVPCLVHAASANAHMPPSSSVASEPGQVHAASALVQASAATQEPPAAAEFRLADFLLGDTLGCAIDSEKATQAWVDRFHGDEDLCNRFFGLYSRTFSACRDLGNLLDRYFHGDEKIAAAKEMPSVVQNAAVILQELGLSVESAGDESSGGNPSPAPAPQAAKRPRKKRGKRAQ